MSEFVRELPHTGVGFYPASTFTHIDVRDHESFWVDQSAPGQRTRYAPADEEDGILARALAALPPEDIVLPARAALAAALNGNVLDGLSEVATSLVAAQVRTENADAAAANPDANALSDANANASVDVNANAGDDVNADDGVTAPPAAPSPSPAPSAPPANATDEEVDWSLPWKGEGAP